MEKISPSKGRWVGLTAISLKSIALQRIINLIICLNIILVIYSQWYLPRIAVTCNKDIKIFDVKILIEASFLVAQDRDILSIG